MRPLQYWNMSPFTNCWSKEAAAKQMSYLVIIYKSESLWFPKEGDLRFERNKGNAFGEELEEFLQILPFESVYFVFTCRKFIGGYFRITLWLCCGRGSEKSWLNRKRNWTAMQEQQRPPPIPQGVSGLGWVFIVVLNWGKNPGPLYPGIKSHWIKAMSG